MCGSMNFCQGGPGPTARKQLCQRFLSFFFVLNFYSFTVAYQWFISKKTIILQGFGGGGGGVQPIPGAGAGGPNANSRNP